MTILARIDISLSEKSVLKAIQKVEAYKDKLNRRMETFLNRLAEAGIDVARATIEHVSAEEKGAYSLETRTDGENGVSIVLSGNKVLFVEFGAGIAFSQPQNPKAAEFGYGLGTYPGQTHAYNEQGWWYYGEDGTSRHSRGNAPYMPMYKASVEIRNRVREIAKEVFGG